MDWHAFWVVMVGFSPAFLGGLIAAMTVGHGDHAHYGRSAIVAAVGMLISFVLFSIPMEWGDVGMFQSEARQGLGWLPNWTSPIGWSMLAAFVGALSPKVVGGIFDSKAAGWMGAFLSYALLALVAGAALYLMSPALTSSWVVQPSGKLTQEVESLGGLIGLGLALWLGYKIFSGKKSGGGGGAHHK